MATKKKTAPSKKSGSAPKKTPRAAAPKATGRSKAATKGSPVAKPAVEKVVAEPQGCKHSWVIDPPNGPTSNGHCTVCGEQREFRNSYEYTPSWTARSGKAGAAKANAAKASAARAAASKGKAATGK